jgi:CRISPR-associated protein Cas5d
MNERETEVRLKVRGDYACFTRPEFKVERVSYPVMTPSAARGVLEAIYWKPEIRYLIQQIWVLKQGTQTTIMRNEISSKQARNPIVIENEKERQQRTSLILKDVEYLIFAKMVLRPHTKMKIENYLPQFIDRRDRGRCFHQPYLGNREFTADFSKPSGNETCDPKLVGHTLPLGRMLFDIGFIQQDSILKDFVYFRKHGSTGKKEVKGCRKALFFDALLDNGVLSVPQSRYDALLRMEENYA